MTDFMSGGASVSTTGNSVNGSFTTSESDTSGKSDYNSDSVSGETDGGSDFISDGASISTTGNSVNAGQFHDNRERHCHRFRLRRTPLPGKSVVDRFCRLGARP